MEVRALRLHIDGHVTRRVKMKAIHRLAKVMLSTRFLLAAFALSTLGIVYSAERAERISAEELGTLKAAGIGQGCKGAVGCGAACVAPTCAWRFDRNINQWVCVQVIAGAAGVQAPAATIGTCKFPGISCTMGTPCGWNLVPICVILGNGVCAGVCAAAGAAAGC